MNVGSRGGALTALALLVALGCGGTDAHQAEGSSENGSPAEDVAETLPQVAVGGEAQTGIFVSATMGSTGADGTKVRPVKTIAEGIALARDKGLSVNVCIDTYVETVVLVDGVSMFGYFSCDDLSSWTRVAAHAKIVSSAAPVVLGEKLEKRTRFAGFDIEASEVTPAPAGPAASSIGMLIRGSKNLEIANVTIRGGKGQDGTDGIEPATGNQEVSSEAPRAATDYKDVQVELCGIEHIGIKPGGEPMVKHKPCPTVVYGGAGGKRTCAVGAAGEGGHGGHGARFVDGMKETEAEYRGQPLTATATTAKGGAGALPGTPGASGLPGTLGQNGAWSFTVDGFVPGTGTSGGNGAGGQGGGGGGGRGLWRPSCVSFPPKRYVYAGAGGGGGAGGCGGLPGTAGTGGGGSFGLISIDSNITLTTVRIEGGKGGRAGKGALGTDGTPGQDGGGPAETSCAPGGHGGRGGAGGPAGLSGSGSAGPSIALVYHGPRPTTSPDVKLVPGEGGDAAALVKGAQTLPGAPGESKQEHSF